MRLVHSREYAAMWLDRLLARWGQWYPTHGTAFAVMIVAFALGAPSEWSYASAALKDREAKPKDKAEKTLKPEKVGFLEDTILRLTNIVRKRRGLKPLMHSNALVFLARHHSRDMCRTGVFMHESESFPAGWRRFMERMKIVGLRDGGENIAYRTLTKDGKKWAVSIVKGWVGSPPHLKNMLEPSFRYSGVGIEECGQTIVYVTQVFSGESGRLPVPPRAHRTSRLKAKINGTVDDVTRGCIE